MSDKKISSALKFIGKNREMAVVWMKSRLGVAEKGQNRFVMMDSTRVSSASETLGINAKSYNPNHDFDKQIRLMYLFAARRAQTARLLPPGQWQYHGYKIHVVV